MSLKEFATGCGVSLVDCGEGWEGAIGYTEYDIPNCTTCGFKTENSAYIHWLKSKFGERTSKEIVKLLQITDKINKS